MLLPPLGLEFDEIYRPFVSLWQRECSRPTIKIYRLEGG